MDLTQEVRGAFLDGAAVQFEHQGNWHMADEEKEGGGHRGALQLGRDRERLGRGLGRLQEAWQVRTGRPVLLLRPDKHVDWMLESGWRVSLSTHRKPPFVKLVVHRAPAEGRTTKLTDLFVLFAAAFQRVEDDASMDTHLTSGPRSDLEQVRGPARTSRRGWSLAVTVLSLISLGAGFWLRGVHDAGRLEGQASEKYWTDGADLGLAIIAYPMPQKPSPTQATPPCDPGEVEINGGCWATLEQQPPCAYKSYAEYKGKCYLAIGKKQTPLPQSVKQ